MTQIRRLRKTTFAVLLLALVSLGAWAKGTHAQPHQNQHLPIRQEQPPTKAPHLEGLLQDVWEVLRELYAYAPYKPASGVRAVFLDALAYEEEEGVVVSGMYEGWTYRRTNSGDPQGVGNVVEFTSPSGKVKVTGVFASQEQPAWNRYLNTYEFHTEVQNPKGTFHRVRETTFVDTVEWFVILTQVRADVEHFLPGQKEALRVEAVDIRAEWTLDLSGSGSLPLNVEYDFTKVGTTLNTFRREVHGYESLRLGNVGQDESVLVYEASASTCILDPERGQCSKGWESYLNLTLKGNGTGSGTGSLTLANGASGGLTLAFWGLSSDPILSGSAWMETEAQLYEARFELSQACVLTVTFEDQTGRSWDFGEFCPALVQP